MRWRACSRVALDPVDHGVDIGDDDGSGGAGAVALRGAGRVQTVQHPGLDERVAPVALSDNIDVPSQRTLKDFTLNLILLIAIF